MEGGAGGRAEPEGGWVIRVAYSTRSGSDGVGPGRRLAADRAIPVPLPLPLPVPVRLRCPDDIARAGSIAGNDDVLSTLVE